jgi:hypothetical protein
MRGLNLSFTDLSTISGVDKKMLRNWFNTPGNVLSNKTSQLPRTMLLTGCLRFATEFGAEKLKRQMQGLRQEAEPAPAPAPAQPGPQWPSDALRTYLGVCCVASTDDHIFMAMPRNSLDGFTSIMTFLGTILRPRFVACCKEMAVKAENATAAETAEPDFTANCTRRLFSPLLALFNSLVLSREHFKIDPVTAQPTLTESAASSAEPRVFGTILYDARLCVIAASQCLHKVVTHSEDGSPLFGTVLGRVLEKMAHCKNLMDVLHSTGIVTGYDSCRDADKKPMQLLRWR